MRRRLCMETRCSEWKINEAAIKRVCGMNGAEISMAANQSTSLKES